MSRRSSLPLYKKKTARFTLQEALLIEKYSEDTDQSYSQITRMLWRNHLNNNPTINNLTDELRVREIGF